MTESTEKVALTKAHREVLTMLADRTLPDLPDPGWMTSSATFPDGYLVGIHWRTAQHLHRRGLVTYPYIGSGYEGDGTSIALTDAGWAALGRIRPGTERDS